MKKTQSEQILAIIKNRGIIRSRDLDEYFIHPESLSRLVRNGKVKRVRRGIYTLPDNEPASSFHGFAEITKLIPNAIICLLSALNFHDITTQIPFQVWIAIDERARRPEKKSLALRLVRFSGNTLTEGVEEHLIENVPVKITNPARTIADCFKYRNKIGLDVALEALKDGLQQRKCTRDELWKYAKICRVTNVIRPYMEALS
ncbi:type IV toxin-antitoxin system AbiEi family antitoxin domain-containing protein [bacterium]